MHIIGIDLGLKTGVSCYSMEQKKIIDYRTISKPESNDMPYSFYFKKELKEFCTHYEPYKIVYELLPLGIHSSKKAIAKLSVLSDALHNYCYENNIERIGHVVQKIKHYYCGIHNARKDEVRSAMAEKGIELTTTQHDIVDSIALIYYHLSLEEFDVPSI